MKKKAIILACLCSISICICKVWAMFPSSESINNVLTEIPHGYDEILLQGNLMLSIGPNIIEAGANNEEVYIQFNQNCGNVSISLYDNANNLIYHNNVNTGVQPIVIIPINSTTEGIYTLELNSIDGGADGYFEHN